MKTNTPALAILLACIAVALSGCTLLQPRADTTRISPANQLLFYSRALVMASPSGRAAMLESARDAHAAEPTPMTTAHLALAYGQPGYKGYAPDDGARYAQQSLDEGAAYWDTAATAFLRHFAALSAASGDARAANGTMHQQLAELRRSLAQAQHKLEALTRIETELSQ